MSRHAATRSGSMLLQLVAVILLVILAVAVPAGLYTAGMTVLDTIVGAYTTLKALISEGLS